MFYVVSVPVPYQSSRFNDLLTRSRYDTAGKYFMGTHLKGEKARLREPFGDGIVWEWESLRLQLFEDGIVRVLHERVPTQTAQPVIIQVRYLGELIRDVVNAQREFPLPAYDAYVSVGLLGGSGNRLSDGEIHSKSPPDPWLWNTETSTAVQSVERLVEEFRVRLVRSTGAHAFISEHK